MLEARGVTLSMDGADQRSVGRWIDNVFIERFWRSLKYEEVYLHAYDDLRDARRRIERYLEYYNHGRSHQSLEGLTPEQVYHHDSAGALVPSLTARRRSPAGHARERTQGTKPPCPAHGVHR